MKQDANTVLYIDFAKWQGNGHISQDRIGHVASMHNDAEKVYDYIDLPGTDNDKIYFANHSLFDDVDEISIEIECMIDSLGAAGNYGMIVGKSDYDGNRCYRLRLENGTDLVWHISNDGADPGAAEINVTASDYIAVGRWHTILCTYNNNQSDRLRLYVDGKLVDEQTGESGPIHQNSVNLTIGGYSNDDAVDPTKYATNMKVRKLHIKNVEVIPL